MGYARRLLLDEPFLVSTPAEVWRFAPEKNHPLEFRCFTSSLSPGPPFFGVPAVSFQGKKGVSSNHFKSKTPSKEGETSFWNRYDPCNIHPFPEENYLPNLHFFCSRLIFPGCKTNTSPEGSGLSFSLLPSLKQTAKAMLIFQGVRFVFTVFFQQLFILYIYIIFRKTNTSPEEMLVGRQAFTFWVSAHFTEGSWFVNHFSKEKQHPGI